MILSGWYTFWANRTTQHRVISTGSGVIWKFSIFWMEKRMFEYDIKLVKGWRVATGIKSRVLYDMIMKKELGSLLGILR